MGDRERGDGSLLFLLLLLVVTRVNGVCVDTVLALAMRTRRQDKTVSGCVWRERVYM